MSNNDSEIKKADELISAVIDNLDKQQIKESLGLLKGWKSIVSSISTDGNSANNSFTGDNNFTDNEQKNKLGDILAAHSRVIDLKNGILLIETDHPSYIQIFYIYNNYILNGLKKNFPQLEIKTLSYRLKGTEHKIHDIEIEKKVKKEEIPPSNLKIDESLPPDLKERFEKLRKGLLTKDK